MNRLSIQKIFSTAKTEYVKWVCNGRMILAAAMLFFIYSFTIQPLQEHAAKMGSPLNILEPFIAMVNSEVLAIIVPAVFMALCSDFPRTDGNTLFFIQRIGKANWMIGQVLFAIAAVFSYIAVLFLGSVLPVIHNSFWANIWSFPVTKYAEKFPEESQSFACLLIKNNVYNQVSPWQAAVHGYLLMMCYLLVIMFIMLLSGLRKKIGKEEVKKAMEEVGLDYSLKRMVKKYSLGMRQRLGIAQAIMENPSLLILDEPFNGLDKEGVEDMRKYMLKLKENGTTLVISSHSTEDIDILCDTVCEMDKGTLTRIR